MTKTTANGKSHGMRAVSLALFVWWTKITIIYNLRDVYQTKDIRSWSESLKSVQVWVIEKSFNWALDGSCKSTAENVDRSKLVFTITAEIHARSLVKFYRQYADRHMNLYFMRRVSKRERPIRQFVIVKNKLKSFFNTSVLLLTMNFVIALSK